MKYKKWNVEGMVGIIKQDILNGYIELEDDNFNYSNPTLTYCQINVEYSTPHLSDHFSSLLSY